MRVNERMKKVFSILLCLCMVLQYVPTTAFAAEAAEGGLCEHHAEHTAECGYAEAVAGSDCTHSHDELCGYAEAVAEVKCACEATDENGALVHTEGCGYVAPVEGSNCTHVHDDACGYAEAVEAHECHYECAECAAAAASEEAPEESSDPAPVCTCAEACTTENFNEYCAVCGVDYSKCTGTDTAVAYAEGDKVSVTINGETTYYTSIKDAVAKANESGNATITLLQDTTTGERLDITTSATLDLNGNTLSCATYFADDYETMVAVTTSGAKLTIMDSIGGGKLDGTDTTFVLLLGKPGSVGYTYTSSAEISGGTVSGWVRMQMGSSMTVSGGTVENNTSSSTVEMYSETTLNVSSGQILNTYEYGNTRCAIDNGGTVNITGGTVSGYIGVRNSGTANISGNANIIGTVCSVKSWVETQDSTLTITGGNYTGGINITGGTATISGGSYTGGIVVSGGTATISGGTITESSAENAVEVFDSAELTISGGTFSATADGNIYETGVYVHDGGTVKITGGTITSTVYGVYNEGGSATITGGSISGGTVDLYVGGSDSILNLTLDEGKTVGATFPGGITVEGTTLAELLATETATYWGVVDGKDTMLTVSDDAATGITDKGDITIRAICDHKDVKLDYITTETTHTPVCSVCNWTGEATEHTGGTATCQNPAVCEACGVSYGDLDANIHTPTEGTIFTDNGDGTHSYICACGAAVAEVPHTLDVTTGKCSACGADMTVVATVTDGITTLSASDAATLNQAVTAILETGSRTFTVELPADAEAGMITAIRRAICDTEGVADGSIHLTLKGVTTIPGTTNWDGVAFGPGDIYDEAGKIVDQELVTQLASINLPDVTEIGAQAFYFCENLVSVSAPKAQTIGAQAFGYTALTSVEFPKLTTIPTDMFSGTWTLSSAKFPKVTTIEQGGLLVGAKFTPENNPTPFPLELTAEGNITFNGSNHFNIASQNYSGKVDLVLCCDKKDAVTFNENGTATWQVREDLSYTFKSITFKHSYVNGKCTACGEDCTHTGGTATCTTLAVCDTCGVSYGAVDTTNHDSSVECENGLCPNGCYEPAILNAAGYYEIDNAGKLFWFAQQVNVKGNREIKGVLTAHIDLENKPWTPIGETGEENNNFRGVFDGQNYTIKGLYVEGSENGVGFFGEVRTGTVKNFRIYGNVVVNTEVNYVGGVIGSICGVNGETSIEERNGAVIQNITSFVNVTAKAHGIGMIGGFVGYANHQSLIEKCAWYGTFDAGEYRVDSGAGGFIGKIQENTSEVTIRNCGAYGTIKTNYAGDYNNTATIYMGGFLSFSNTNAKTVLENCLFAGRFERGANLTDQAELAAFGTLRSVNAIKNCYYLGDDGLAAVHSDSDMKPGSDNVEITSVTGEELRSNTIATQLGDHWMQDVHYPIPKDTKAHSDSATYTYTDNGDGTHKATCTVCGYVEVYNEAHSGGTATCTEQAECQHCGASYGEVGGHSPDAAGYTVNADGTHSYTCSSCGNPFTERHTFTDGACTGCGVIGGYCGEEGNEQNVIWTYANGTLTISGTGAMADQFDNYNNRPWEEYVDQITTIVVNDGITSIGEAAFWRFQKLTTAKLPDSLTTISQQAFYGCTALKTVNFPANLKTIEGWAFLGCALESVTLPEGLTTIGYRAFSECKNLTSVTVPASVTTIDEGAFGYSPAKITVAEDNLNYSSDEHGVLFDKDKTTLIYCRPNIEVETYTIPSTVTEICKEAFYGCKNLATITIPDGVQKIGSSAFGSCEAMTTITIPAGVTTIEANTFYDCTALTAVTIPAGVTTIDMWAFSGCTALTTVTIPASVTSIAYNAFSNCSALTTVNVPCTWDGSLYTFDEGVTVNKVHNWTNGTCTVCGEPCDHKDSTHTTATDNGDGTHSFECSVCVNTVIEDHTGGTATCTEQAECQHCGASYGELADHSTSYSADGMTITYKCATCDTQTVTFTLVIPTGAVYGGALEVPHYDSSDKTYQGDYPEITLDGALLKDFVPGAKTYEVVMTWGGKTVSGEYTIAKADVGITAPTPNTLTYTGEAQYLISAGEAVGGTMVYSLTEDGEYTTSIPKGTNAGDYKVWYYVQGDANHKDSAKDSVDVTIAKAEPKAEDFVFQAPGNLTYDGETKSASVSVQDGIVGMGEIVAVMYYVANPTREQQPISAGNYFVKINVGEGENYTAKSFFGGEDWVFTIAPMQIYIDPAFGATLADVVYNESGVYTLTVTGVAFKSVGAGNTVPLTLGTDYTATATQDEVSYGEIIKVVRATVEVTLKNGNYQLVNTNVCTATANIVEHEHAWTYTAKDDTITATCNAEGCPDAEQSITISAVGKTYDSTPVTATLTGSIDGVATPEITYTGNTNAGTHTASITIEGETASVEFTIEKATVTVTADAKSKPYGTDNPALTYTSEGLFGDDVLTGALETTATKTSNVGEYDITVGSLGSSNYTIDFVGAKLTITKAAAPEIQWPTAAELTYGQKLSDSALTSQDKNGTFAWQDGSIVPTVKNNGYVVVYTPKDTDNYDYTVVELTETIPVTVSKVSATVTAAPTPNTLAYTGEGQYLISAGEANGGTMQYSTDNQTWSTTIPQGTDAGKYTVYYKVVGDENHSDTAVDSIEVTIAKADPVIGTVGCEMDLYDSTAISNVELTRTDMSVEGTLVLTDSELTAGEGTYNWKFTPEDTDNYNIITGTVVLTVTADVLEQIRATGTLEKFSYVYGEPFSIDGMTVTASYTSGTTKDVTGLVSFDRTLAVGQTAVELTYQGKICVIDGITVARKQLNVSGMSWTVPTNAVYSGTAYTATLNGTLPEGVSVTKTGDKATNAGSYTAKAVFSLAEGYSADNYEIVNGEDLTAEWSIDKAALTITADSYESVRYGSAAPAFAANYSGFVNGETEAVLSGELVFSCEYDTANAAKRKPGDYPIVPSGLTSNNYEISYVDGNLEVISANLVIVIDDKTVTYGDAAPEYTYHYEGFVYGEDISVMDEPGTVSCAYVPGNAVGTMEIKSDNYGSDDCYFVVNQRIGTLTVEKAPLTITAEDNSITYGDAPAANGVTGTGFVNGESFDDLSGELTYSYNYEQFGNVGTYKITPSGVTSNNYEITFADGTLTVNDKAITVTADAVSKTFGDADPKLTYKVEGLVNGDELTGELNRAAGENVGSYAIEQNTLTAGNNYSITYTGANLTINAKAITEADVELNGSLTYTGKEQTQPITVTEGITYTVTGDKATNVGSYVLTVKGTGNYTGEVKLNWSIKEAAAVVGKAPTAKELTYTGTAQALVNAGTTADGKLVYSLSENGEFTESIPTGTNAGEYTVWYYVQGDDNHSDTAKASVKVTIAKADPVIGTVGCEMDLYDSTAISNVELTRTDMSVDGTLVLTDAKLTAGEGTYNWKFTPKDTDNYNTITGTVVLNVTADVLEKIEANGNLEKDSYSYGDTFSIDGLTVTATYTSGATKDVTGLVSFDSTLAVGQTSVELTYQGKTCTVTGFTVAKKQLIIDRMAWDIPENAVYNGTEYTATLNGTLPTGVVAALSGDKATNAGSYTAKAVFSLAEGYSAENYEIVNGEDLTADWTIAKKNIVGAEITLGTALTYNGKQQTQAVASVKIDGLTVTYTVSGNTGTDAKGYTLTVTGNGNFEGTETKEWSIAKKNISGATITLGDSLTYNGDAQTQEVIEVKIGDLTVTYDVTDNKQLGAGNYTLTVTGNGNFEGSATADWSIAKAKLTITANNNSITYGDVPAANGVTGTGFVSSEDIEDLSGELTYSYNYEQFGNVGTYKITPSGVTSNNYEITFADGTLTVNAKDITVTADAVSKTYGEADPTLTYTAQGLVNGDELTGELKRVAGENVGDYAIEQNTLTAGNNYRLTYTGAKLTINAKAITAADVKLNGSLTYNGKEQTQPITVTEGITYEVSGNKATNAGAYELIVEGTGNYTGSVTLDWTIAKAKLTITADSKVIYIGEKLPTLTYTTSGLVGGDKLTKEPALTTNADADQAGSYTITAANADAGDNYTITYVNGSLTIMDKKTEVETKIEQTELTEVPEGLKDTQFDTLEEIKEELISKILATSTGYSAENMVHYDVALHFSLDGGDSWILATEENFPTEGITVILPYPEGTNARDYEFVVSHMFTVTSQRLGTVAGEVEMPKVEETANGIRVTLNGLSPVTVAARYHDHTGGTATCTEKAVCTICGNAYGEVDKTNHAGGTEVKNAKEATCGAEGYTGDIYCKGCNEVVEKGTTIEATGEHTYGDWKVVKEPTKTTKGEKQRTCSVCGHVDSKEIPVLSDTPATGDNSNIMLYSSMFTVSLAGLVVLLLAAKKRKQETA